MHKNRVFFSISNTFDLRFTIYDLRFTRWNADMRNSGNLLCSSIERSDFLILPYMAYMVINLRGTIYDIRSGTQIDEILMNLIS
jgi:hypothetical protein